MELKLFEGFDYGICLCWPDEKDKGNYRKTLSKVGKCVVAVLDINSIDFILGYSISQFNQFVMLKS